VPEVSLNDERVEVAANTSLADALPSWTTAAGEETGRRFVVAINKEFVPRSSYAEVILQDGDEIDLVRPVWGG
jgi:sulfur carrier protein